MHGGPTRESICQIPEPFESAEGEDQEGSIVSAGCASVEVAEENPRSYRVPHGEFDVLRLEDRGARGPTSSIADVYQCGFDGVGSGGSSLTEVMRCSCESNGREALSCRVGTREPPREGVGNQ